MSLFSRYVLKEWAIAFALTIGVIIGILILQSMMDKLPDLIDANAGFGQICFFFALELPTYIPAIMPIAFLVSLLFSLGNLHRNNEIIAMRASGASLLRISRPLWIVGLLLSIFLLYLTSMVVPRAVEQFRTFFDNLEYAAMEAQVDAREIGLIYNLGYDNRKDGRLWFMNRFSERAWLALGVNVHTRGLDGRESSRISAAEAYYDDTQGHWVFVNGRELVIDPESGDPLRTINFKQRAFKDFDEDPALMLALHKKPNELSLNELRRIIDTMPAEENPVVHAYLVRFYALLASPFSCLVIVGIAVPFAVSGVRTNPMIGISKSLGYFAVFYVLISVAAVFGERQIIAPWLAAWLPNLLLLGVAFWLYRRAQ
jgi:lipopolysaccharide export system permease protein